MNYHKLFRILYVLIASEDKPKTNLEPHEENFRLDWKKRIFYKFVWASERRTSGSIVDNPLEMHKRLSANYVHSTHQPLFVYKRKFVWNASMFTWNQSFEQQRRWWWCWCCWWRRWKPKICLWKKNAKWNVFVALVHLICFRFGQIERMSERVVSECFLFTHLL